MKNFSLADVDQKTSLVNLASSVLSHYGVSPFHPSIPEVDELFKNHDKIALFLFDGASEYNLSLYPHTTRYMLEHKFMSIHSVNPATTVACTTALLTGKNPIENGWLGWSLYVPGYDDPIDVFPNTDSLTGEKIAAPDVMKKVAPLTYLDELLASKGVKAKLDLQYPLSEGKGPKTLKEMRLHAEDFFHQGGQFYYGYWTNPDHVLHEKGVRSVKLRHVLRGISAMVKRFVKENPDVLVLTLADHGLVDVQYRDIKAFPAVESCLEKPLCLEGRTAAFFIKKGMESQFESAFNKEFGQRFALVKTEDALKAHYFGEGEIAPTARLSLGNYLAIGTDDQLLMDTRTHHDFRVHEGHHAGATPEEKTILLAAYNR
jgi:predicted AlkP superfamily pyrophosphatase or phosphodiesterase